MREGDVRLPVSGGGGTSTSSAWRGNGVRNAVAKRQRNSHNGTRKANVEVREGTGLKVFRKEGETRIPARGGDKEGGEGVEGISGREREAKETKEKETGIDSVP